MEDQILNFNTQFAWEPEIENADQLPETFSHVIVCGMGGSHLGARLLKEADPTLPLTIHSDYGLPREPDERLQSALIVASSYSGETEETLDAARAAAARGLSVACVTTGGALATLAREQNLPLILMPKDGTEPRMAIGASMLALARLLRNADLERAVREAGTKVDMMAGKEVGANLATSLMERIPVVYASTANAGLAYFWKIALNETGKLPAFYNLFPELCHNELSGFDTTPLARPLAAHLHAIILADTSDHPRVTKRQQIVRAMLEERGVTVSVVEIEGETAFDKIFSSVLTGVWVAVALAAHYQVPDDAATPIIADFKAKMLES